MKIYAFILGADEISNISADSSAPRAPSLNPFLSLINRFNISQEMKKTEIILHTSVYLLTLFVCGTIKGIILGILYPPYVAELESAGGKIPAISRFAIDTYDFVSNSALAHTIVWVALAFIYISVLKYFRHRERFIAARVFPAIAISIPYLVLDAFLLGPYLFR